MQSLLSDSMPRDIYANLPNFGQGRITPERFISTSYMEREWHGLWTKTWLCGPHVSELPKPGDYIIEDLGRQSIVFVRGEDNVIRAFHNVCPHRGNQLVTKRIQGRTGRFRCMYHGWQFDLQGECVHIPDMEEFPQFACGANQSEVGLSSVRSETWNGFAWYNLNPNCGPLMDHIGPLASHIAPYEMEQRQLVAFVTYEWPCNWKIAADAFNEAYHFEAQHPEMVQYGDDMPEFEFLGEHSVMKMDYGTVSQKLNDRNTLNPHMLEWMSANYGFNKDNYAGPAKDVALEHRRRVREVGAFYLADYSRLADRQITEDWSYLCFPNTSWNVMAEGNAAYRYRPHPIDPNKCFYDLSLYGFLEKGVQPPRVQRKRLSIEADLFVEMPEMPRQGALAIMQDMASVGFIQNGMHSLGFRGLLLGNQEIRLRHFYHTLDNYLAKYNDSV